MAENEEVDVELGDELGQDIHRLTDDKMIEHRQPVAGEQGVRVLEVALHVFALVGKRDLGHVFSRKEIRGRVMNHAGEVNFDRGIRRNAYRFVQRQSRFRSAVVSDEDLAIHSDLPSGSRVALVY